MKDQLIAIFQDTYDFCLNSLCKETWRLCSNTVLYQTDDYPRLTEPRYSQTGVSVDDYRTFASAKRYVSPDIKVGVLNFASATSPGGGVIWGSKAQEEALCRCSNLYFPLADKHANGKFYNKYNTARYTDDVLYSPDVIVFKTDTELPVLMDKKDWYNVNVLTCAAPKMYDLDISNIELYAIHIKRAIHLLTVAAANNIDVLVLGAFGCGAFKNDPKVVAQAYKSAIQLFGGYFKQIVFSVYCLPQSDINYQVFKETFKNTTYLPVKN